MLPYETNKPIGVILFDVNGDPVDFGGGGGGNVTVTNFPSYYPLPLNVVDSGNSTNTPLAADGVFTGTGIDLTPYAGVTVTIYADRDSIANGLHFEWSMDGSNWYIETCAGFDYESGQGRQFQFTPQTQYFRVRFENGNQAQSVFQIQTILHTSTVALETIHRADANLAPDRSADATKAILMAQVNGSGAFVPVQASNAGVLKTSGSGGGVTDTAYNEDSQHSSGDAGSFVMAVRADTPTEATNQDGDYSGFTVDQFNRTWTHDPLAESLLTSIEAKDFATAAKQDALFAALTSVDFATDSTLTSILAKIIATPATEAKQDTIIDLLDDGSDTGTSSSVNDSATSVTLLAANANRRGASFYNDSSATLYLKCGSTASLTSFTIPVEPRGYYELPFKYAGIIDGIWSSAAGGAVRITEFT